MKRFILTTALILAVFLTSLEVIIRLLGIAGSTMPNASIDGEYRLKPGSQGVWVKGPQGNIKSEYNINKQGFNSLLDDYEQDSSELKIALIGDSYIEGLHVNVQSSIGRTVEDLYTESEVSVHEYGISGWNAHNFLQTAQEIQTEYNLVFVLITEKDLIDKHKSNPGQTDPSIARRIYDEIHILRYLNINRGILKKIKKIGPRGINGDSENIQPNINYELIRKFPENTIFLYEESKFLSLPSHGVFLKIDHMKQPINFGKVDSHWNFNGRLNCARTIVNYLLEYKPTNISAGGF